MSVAALLLAAVTPAAAPALPDRRGSVVAQVEATAVILEPVIVRQDRGIEQRKDTPRPQRTSRKGAVLYEFQ